MYRWYNANTEALSERDCVCRAISTALRLPFAATDHLLMLVSDHWQCPELCMCCYRHLLEDIFGLSPQNAEGETVDSISSSHPKDTVIIRINGHLTCSIGGVILDTWDCRDELVDVYWLSN